MSAQTQQQPKTLDGTGVSGISKRNLADQARVHQRHYLWEMSGGTFNHTTDLHKLSCLRHIMNTFAR